MLLCDQCLSASWAACGPHFRVPHASDLCRPHVATTLVPVPRVRGTGAKETPASKTGINSSPQRPHTSSRLCPQLRGAVLPLMPTSEASRELPQCHRAQRSCLFFREDHRSFPRHLLFNVPGRDVRSGPQRRLAAGPSAPPPAPGFSNGPVFPSQNSNSLPEASRVHVKPFRTCPLTGKAQRVGCSHSSRRDRHGHGHRLPWLLGTLMSEGLLWHLLRPPPGGEWVCSAVRWG